MLIVVGFLTMAHAGKLQDPNLLSFGSMVVLLAASYKTIIWLDEDKDDEKSGPRE